MRRIAFVLPLLLPLAAHAQQAPQQFCMRPATAQSVASALQAGQAAMALMQEEAQEPQRQAAAVAAAKADAAAGQAKAIADAVAKQKADDEAAKVAAIPPKEAKP